MVATLGRRADGRHGRRAFIFSYVYFMNFCTMRFAHLFHGLFKLEDGGKEEAWTDWAGQQKEPHGESRRPYRQKGAWGRGVGHQELGGPPAWGPDSRRTGGSEAELQLEMRAWWAGAWCLDAAAPRASAVWSRPSPGHGWGLGAQAGPGGSLRHAGDGRSGRVLPPPVTGAASLTSLVPRSLIHCLLPLLTFLVAQTVKVSSCNAGDPGSIPVGKIPWRRKWQPIPVFSPGESHGQRYLVGYSPWGHKESDMTERLHFHFPPLYNELLKAECARTHSPKRKRGLRQTLGSPGRTRAQPGPPVGKRHRAALMRGKISEGRAPPGMRPLVASGQQWACSLGCWLWVKTC